MKLREYFFLCTNKTKITTSFNDSFSSGSSRLFLIYLCTKCILIYCKKIQAVSTNFYIVNSFTEIQSISDFKVLPELLFFSWLNLFTEVL